MRLLLATLLLAGVAAPAGAQNVGITSAVNQQARGTPPSQAVRTLALGDNIIFNERIDTNPIGLLQILLADGTAFTAGPNSSLTIDRFVYDPNRGTAEVSATLTKGVFRFIGGKTSKTPNGVRINSPVGTIGIRGAVVDIAMGGRGDGTVSMVFGREVTLTGPNGQTNRVYEPGYSIVVETGPDGKQTRQVVKTPPAAAGQIQTALAGRPGTTGGSANPPTDRIVADSDVPRDNSQLALVVNPPVPQPRPEPRSEVLTAVQEQNVDVVREDVVEEAGTDTPIQPGPGPEPEPEPEPNPTTLTARLLTAGQTFTNSDGEVVQNPGATGLVGGSADEDRIVTLRGGGTASGSTNRGTLVLPLFADAPSGGLRAEVIGQEAGASLGGVQLLGGGFVGSDGFRFYQLILGNDLTQPVYALAGTPIADASRLSSGDIRTYSFTPDLLQGLPVPFMQNGVLGVDYSTASITPFYLAENTTVGNPKLFQSWLVIDGVGPEQRSGIGVTAAVLGTDDSDALSFDFGRRGSYRDDAYGLSYRMGGAIAGLKGPNGGNQLFGSNGQYLVLGTDITGNNTSADGIATGGLSPDFGTFHLLGLQDERSAADFAANQGTTRNLGASGTQAIRGFAAGLQEGFSPNNGYNDVSDSGSDPNAVYVEFNRQRNSVGGELEIGTTGLRTHVAFGAGVLGNTSGGQNAYVDDDKFGAIQNGNRQRTTVTVTDDNGAPATYPQVRDNNPNTYFVSGDANPQPNLLPNGQMCACKFLEWGWWGTAVRARADNVPDDADNRIQSQVHLGQWVAGDVTTNAQVATLSGSASYAGSALGHVTVRDNSGIGDYLASGSMRMTYDFGSRAGSMNIDNFDGRNFAGTIGANTGDTPDALFNGGLAQTNSTGGANDASGAVNGAFVNNGSAIAAGVIGNFNLGSGDGAWNASGIVAGARTP
ncbi:FecR domain-containing protein [Aureimonas leprariae]|uniref:FecR protein domain-containing protein n=1 Tax=Plantimonas leprariae TaxID=2615207 RepID=A0A7V7PTN2_9HYPH|nr:FecR domain-containing protein [Aureimonas leprariae]KAB0682934.1 hypothetical protein F6X38_02305 [Aureimonas leprariae]